MIEAVLWDNDGVLVDTEGMFYEANRQTLERIGLTLSIEDFAEINLGRGESVLRTFAATLGMEADEVDALHAERNKLYSSMLAEGAPVLPGVEEALQQLHGTLKMAIVTSSLPDHFELIHAHSGLPAFFDLILTRDKYGKAKPNPEPYETSALHLGVAPEHCIVVEDTERGLRSACEAGMRCIVQPNRLADTGDFSGAYKVVGSALEAAEEIIRLSKS